MKSRKPISKGLKLLRGDRRRGLANADQPVITACVPSKPKGLARIESAYWNSLVKNLNQRRVFHPGMGGIRLIACSFYQGVKKSRRPASDEIAPWLLHWPQPKKQKIQQNESANTEENNFNNYDKRPRAPARDFGFRLPIWWQSHAESPV
jgi:hypothetical protein